MEPYNEILKYALGLWSKPATQERYLGKIDIRKTPVLFKGVPKAEVGKEAIINLLKFSLNPLHFLSLLSSVEKAGISKESKLVKGREVDPRYFGVICPLETPESEKIGISLHLAKDVVLDDEGNLLPGNEQLRNLWKGRRIVSKLSDNKWLLSWIEYIPLKNTDGNTIPYWKHEKVVWHIDVVDHKPKDAIEIENDYDGFLGYAALLVPFIQHNDGARAMMGAKNAKQALIPINPEVPIVQSGYEEEVANLYRTLLDPVVKQNMDPTEYVYHKGKFVDQNKFLQSNKTREDVILPDLLIDYEPIHGKKPERILGVRQSGFPLLEFHPEEVVGRDEYFYTVPGIKDNKLALGVNARVAYLPFFGYNFEDAIVVSESFARKLTTKHLYTLDIPPSYGIYEGQIKFSKDGKSIEGFFIIKNGKHKKTKLDLPPEVINGDSKKIIGIFRKKDEVYKREVWIQVEKSLKVGDKLTGRHGNKGVVSLILPDDKMPTYTLNGKKYVVEVILNPHGVISRMNLGQLYETHTSLIIKHGKEVQIDTEKWERAGRPFKNTLRIEDFKEAWKKLGLSERGTVNLDIKHPFDSSIKGKVSGVVGYQYILKLAHLADEKITARGISGPRSYALNQPLKGRSRNGGQRFGEMEGWALLSHGAVDTLRELLFESADGSDRKRREEFYKKRTLKEHYSFGSRKALEDILWGAFIDLRVDSSKNTLEVRYISDEEFLQVQNAVELKSIEGLLPKNEKEDVERFMYIRLKSVYSPNERRNRDFFYIHPWLIEQLPANVRPFLKGEKFMIKDDNGWYEAVYEWKDSKFVIEDTGKVKKVEEFMGEGGSAKIKVGIEAAEKFLRIKGDKKGLEKLKSMPRHSIIPIIPYKYRLFCEFYSDLVLAIRGKKKNQTAYENNLTVQYGRILNTIRFISRGQARKEAKHHNHIFRAMLLRIIYKLYTQVYKDILFGKEGLIRSYMLGKRIDRSARGVIIPDPDIPPTKIKVPQMVLKRIFEKVETSKPRRVLFNRQPTLHKYSIFSFEYEDHKKKNDYTIHVSPLICSPYNADFDGDTMAIYATISRKSQKELEEMTFLKHYRNIITGKLNLHISQDIKLGLSVLRENINNTSVLWVRLKKNILQLLPDEYQTEDALKNILSDSDKLVEAIRDKVMSQNVSEEEREERLALRLRDLSKIAFIAATFSGVTSSIYDFVEVKELFEKYLKMDSLDKKKFENLEKSLVKTLGNAGLKNNSAATLVRTGARGKPEQLLQMIYARKLPVLTGDKQKGDEQYGDKKVQTKDNGNTNLQIKVEKSQDYIVSSLLEGHSPLDYFILSFNTRISMTDKKLSVANAGYFTRRLVFGSIDFKITSKRCGNQKEHTPLGCHENYGVCLSSLKNLPGLKVGDYVGVFAATSIGERGTQLSMQSFHTGGKMKLDLRGLEKKLLQSKELVEVAEEIQKIKNDDAFKNHKKEVFEVIYKSRLRGDKILSIKEAVEERDFFVKLSFEEGMRYIKSVMQRGVYRDEKLSDFTHIYLLGKSPKEALNE